MRHLPFCCQASEGKLRGLWSYGKILSRESVKAKDAVSVRILCGRECREHADPVRGECAVLQFTPKRSREVFPCILHGNPEFCGAKSHIMRFLCIAKRGYWARSEQ